MKSGDTKLFLAVRRAAAVLAADFGLSWVKVVPLSPSDAAKYYGLAHYGRDRIAIAIRRRSLTRWGRLHQAYQITDTLCHEFAHMYLRSGKHDSAFVVQHANILRSAGVLGVHRRIERAFVAAGGVPREI